MQTMTFDRSMRSYRMFLGVLFLLMAFLLIAGCSPREPIKIGFVGGLSGRVADLGFSGRDGAILAIEERNATGGINGRKVRLIAVDDKQNPAQAVKVVNDLIEKGVVAIIGHMTSSMSMETVPIINKHRLVMVSPTTTTTYLSGKDDYFFRVNATTQQYAGRMAQYMANKAGYRKTAIIYDMNNKAYSESWIEIFTRQFEHEKGVVKYKQAYLSGESVSFYDVIKKVPVHEIDALILVAGAMDTAMLCQQVRKQGLDLPITAAEWAATERLIELGGQAVEGIIVNQFFDRTNKDPKYVEFRDAYQDRFGDEPGFASVNAYDAAVLILNALERQEKGKSLKETILNIKILEGVQGKVRLDNYGDADRKTFMTSIKDGQFAPLE